MSPLTVLITVAVYFVLLFAVSQIASRRTDNAGFFTATVAHRGLWWR